ncbi:LytR C-terminal domain-containing protein [Candidatus Poriferisodalis sp.]|uniref:LytR C-terminal domain-containing protein n=1 Tax=Candidatus Poriferisodalis sp. TaxID=3101277 RepID=UPI003B5C6E23
MNSQAGESNSGAAVRGLLLVLVAVVVGVLLLRSVDDPDDAAVTDTTPPVEPGETLPPATQATTATTAAPGTGGTGSDSVTTVAPPVTADPSTATTAAGAEPFQPRPAAEVSIQVANSTTVRGAAGRLTDRFKTLSYITNTPTNYVGTPLDRTRIYYQPGSLLEARAIAGVLELDADNDVFPMLADPSAVQDFKTPDVLVALGTDLAE